MTAHHSRDLGPLKAMTARRLRVLYILNASEIGGGNKSLLTLWSGLAAHDITPIAVSPGQGPMVEACRDAGVECVVAETIQPDWSSPRASWAGYRRWTRLLKEFHPDVVHANGFRGARSIGLAMRRSRAPLVCHVHFPQPASAIAWTFKYLRKPDVFIINSRAVQADVADALRHACPDAVQRVVYNAVDLVEFQPRPASPRQIPRVGIVANLLPVKGHLDFLEMAALLGERGVAAQYWIVGEDIHRTGYKTVLEERVRELNLSGSVEFLGFRHDVGETLSRIDVLVSCSHEEPFGISLIEAMACERPVVAPRVGGIPEVIEDQTTGFLVTPNAPRELADAVQTLLDRPELRSRMGVAGRQRVQRLFSMEVYAREMAAVYRKLAAGLLPVATSGLSAST